ncbi:MAG: F0F1 ATP synthase subunit delta [Huintestinicola sp.]
MPGSVEKVYSEALLEIAEENGSLSELDEELNALVTVFEANPELTDVLSTPTVSDAEKLELIENVFKGRVSETAFNFLCVLTEKGRCRYLGSIAKAFRKSFYDISGIVEVTVTSTRPLTDSAREKLKAKLEKKYGKKVIMTEKVDMSIMGGLVVTCGDSMLDGSVKTKLEEMHKQIKDMIA